MKKKFAILMNKEGVYSLKLLEDVSLSDNIWSEVELTNQDSETFLNDFEAGAYEQFLFDEEGIDE